MERSTALTLYLQGCLSVTELAAALAPDVELNYSSPSHRSVHFRGEVVTAPVVFAPADICVGAPGASSGSG